MTSVNQSYEMANEPLRFETTLLTHLSTLFINFRSMFGMGQIENGHRWTW